MSSNTVSASPPTWRRSLPLAADGNSTSVSFRANYTPASSIVSIFPEPSSAISASTSAAIHVEAPKSVEARRQIKRLFDAVKASTEDSSELQAKVNDDRFLAAINLLRNFIGSPIEIPVASIDSEGNPSLFINSHNMYADVTFDGSFADYYLKFNVDGHAVEHFDRENVDSNYIPARLFTNLVRVLTNK
jgi:hypothetical protein